MRFRFISAGAAQGLIGSFARDHDHDVEGSFGAVGAMLERFRSGEPADIVVLTHAQVAQLTSKGEVVPGTAADLGAVPTSIAVREGDAIPDVSSHDALRDALLAADAIYFPDPAKATAGIHFAKVLDQLGVRERVGERLRTFPNGATAMRAMSEAAGRPIGCTQSTEIVATRGVRLIAPLPHGLDLETVYTASVHARGAQQAAAEAFVAELTGEGVRDMRRRAGFGGHAIRPATVRDHDGIRAVVSNVLEEYRLAPDPGDADSDLANIGLSYGSGGTFDVVTDASGRIVGSCGVMRLDESHCELRKMYLLPAARGQGLGRRLLDRALAFARGRGYARIELTTASALTDAIAIYRRCGFAPIERAMPGRCDQAYALAL
ncbi:MAG TPA: GNAT family N-acetyltransferase [Usitatibacter sp.]|nr:GNAT family N-acetyltransferase [Usitatibacter sp.]